MYLRDIYKISKIIELFYILRLIKLELYLDYWLKNVNFREDLSLLLIVLTTK